MLLAGNRFLLSSTTFSPALFLSQVHANADTRTLLQGLDTLSQSIDQKSASLKVLVESNFERFVKAKATIDNVYKEMKYRGSEPPQSRARAHSRHASRSSFRNSAMVGTNAPLSPNPLVAPVSEGRKKNALIKESEYGVLGIKAPLLDVSAKAEDVWGPALGGREKEENLKTVSSYLGQYREYVEISTAVADSIKRKDYETLVEEYNKARKFCEQARMLASQLNGATPNETQLYQIVIAGRMWHDVDQQIQSFKRDLWKKLISLHAVSKSENSTGRGQDQHMDLINLLLELGVQDNPIWVWLLSHYDHLKGKITSTAERSKVEIEVLRRRLANGDKPTPQAIANHLRSMGRQGTEEKPVSTDSTEVIELWDKILGLLNSLLGPQGILSEVLDFWQTVQSFIDGQAQKSLPIGYNGESVLHHNLSDKVIEDLKKGAVDLVETLREHLYAFFMGLPPEDISLLFSPIPQTPLSPSPTTPGSGLMSPSVARDPRFKFDATNPPPPSTKKGESWEKLAFWPPWSNSLSGVYYLSKMLALVGSGACDMASIGPIAAAADGQSVERLRTLVGASRERCVTALCAAWNRDAENIKYVEDWQRSAELGDVTRMPASFSAFEGTLLSGMQNILYISDAMDKPGAGNIVLAPPTKLLQMVRSQYVTTLYKALSGMVENAERSVKKTDDEWLTDTDGLVATANVENVTSRSTLDAGDRVSANKPKKKKGKKKHIQPNPNMQRL